MASSHSLIRKSLNRTGISRRPNSFGGVVLAGDCIDSASLDLTRDPRRLVHPHARAPDPVALHRLHTSARGEPQILDRPYAVPRVQCPPDHRPHRRRHPAGDFHLAARGASGRPRVGARPDHATTGQASRGIIQAESVGPEDARSIAQRRGTPGSCAAHPRRRSASRSCSSPRSRRRRGASAPW